MPLRVACSVISALLLAGCAGNLPGDAAPASETDASMAGRWTLAASNAPPCGMIFAAAPGGEQGAIEPDGGCPGNLFASRRWTLKAGTLTIVDDKNNPLASLRSANGNFEGQAAGGMPVTLGR